MENKINFSAELDKMHLAENDDTHRCLISNEPLVEPFIVLDCMHKFNYVPLYRDIYNHKKKFNGYEHKVLKHIEIRCPYCRNVQQRLLPYFPLSGVKQVHGVNHFDETIIFKKMDFKQGVCEGAEVCTECKTGNVVEWDNGKYYCAFHLCKVITEQFQSKLLKTQMELEEKQKAEQLKKAQKQLKEQMAQQKKAAAEEKKKLAQEKKAAAEEKKKLAQEKKAAAEEKKKLAAEAQEKKKLAAEEKKKEREKKKAEKAEKVEKVEKKKNK